MEKESVDRIVAFNLTRIRKRLDMTQQNFADELGDFFSDRIFFLNSLKKNWGLCT